MPVSSSGPSHLIEGVSEMRPLVARMFYHAVSLDHADFIAEAGLLFIV